MQPDILDYPQPSHEEVEKKFNMKTETVLAAVFVVGFLFKVQHWPFSGLLLLLSLGTLSIIYMFFSYYFFSYNNTRTQHHQLSIMGGILLSFVPIATLFNSLHWPGRGIFTLVAMIAAPVVFGVVYFRQKQSPSHLRYYYKNMMIRSTVLTALALILFLRWLILGQFI